MSLSGNLMEKGCWKPKKDEASISPKLMTTPVLSATVTILEALWWTLFELPTFLNEKIQTRK